MFIDFCLAADAVAFLLLLLFQSLPVGGIPPPQTPFLLSPPPQRFPHYVGVQIAAYSFTVISFLSSKTHILLQQQLLPPPPSAPGHAPFRRA